MSEIPIEETAWQKTKRISTTAYSTTRDKALIPTYDKALKPTYDKALKPTYDKALKPGFDKAWKALDKLGAPINRLSNKVGAEAFWPTTLDKESDKAARILRSFCKDGFYGDLDASVARKADKDAKDGVPQQGVPQGKQRVLKKIPERVIRNAKGLAIFTTMRTGLWVSGAGGSGVLVARDQESGQWSPPSGILLHTAGLGFLIGVDIYDCVIVINTYEALEAFTKIRCTLGGEISAVAGPVGIGGLVETEVHKRQAPLFTYLKSRGFYAGVQVDGTIVIERTDENEAFYGERIGVADILAGKAKNPPLEKYRLLLNTIRAAQGDPIDESELPSASDPTPGDFEVDVDGTFGVPDPDDPDPYGVRALEEAGIEIKDANTHERPSAEAFSFQPSPRSPIFSSFARRSIDSHQRAKSASWRNSTASIDRGTQTDDGNTDLHTPSSPPPYGIVTAGRTTDATSGGAIEHSDEQLPKDSDLGPKHIPPALPPRGASSIYGTPEEEKKGENLTAQFEEISLHPAPKVETAGHEGHQVNLATF